MCECGGCVHSACMACCVCRMVGVTPPPTLPPTLLNLTDVSHQMS